MPENSPRGARLDHVSDAGDLVFEAGGERFVVTVDDALERAVLAAKQIRMESHSLRQPRANAALPISRIQQLIRAGADPAQVAERYGLDQALVRRFSASVQMEKQYAIEQFKRIPAPKESRVRTVEDLIYMTLAMARVDRGTLSWQATRRGHEPWRISATFLASGRKVRAEWTWDMHDNTVVCLNPAAKKLLGEQNLGLGGESDMRRPDLAPIIEESMAPQPSQTAGDMDFPVSPAAVNGRTASATSLMPVVPEPDDPSEGGAAADATNRDARPETMGDIPVVEGDASRQSAQPERTDGANGDLPPVPDPEGDDRKSPGSAGTVAAGASDISDDADNGAQDGQPAQAPKRHIRRSAIPSWDQILFGE